MAAVFAKEFMGSSLMAVSNGAKTTMRKTGTKVLKKGKKATIVKKKAGAKKKAGGRKGAGGNFGPNRQLWYPSKDGAPAWLDGSMIGDRGFDPLGLSKPAEFVVFDLDDLDQNQAINARGANLGLFGADKTEVSTDTLSPYNEVFDIRRFRECELIHGRWCMVAALGAIVAEATTGVSWVDAGKVELEGASYLGLELPFTITNLVVIEVALMGYIEFARSSELDAEKRCYPGGRFDPFNLASGPNEANADDLKLKEIKHCRLAMLAFLGFALEAGFTENEGVLEIVGF